jgi:hypothetical protein
VESPRLHNRFTYSTFVQHLLLSRQYERAEHILAKTSAHPEDSLLHWINLQCLLKQPDRAVERLVSLLKAEPENPYFRLAALETFHHTNPLPNQDLVTRYDRIHQLADSVDRPYDVLAKIGHSAAIKGLWSIGLSYFIESMNSFVITTQQQVLLLSPKNKPSLYRFLKEGLAIIDGLVIDDSLNAALTLSMLPDELISRLICILLTATEMEIPEASFIIAKLAARHPELSMYEKSPRSMVGFAVRHSPGWIGLKLPYSPHPIIHWN